MKLKYPHLAILVIVAVIITLAMNPSLRNDDFIMSISYIVLGIFSSMLVFPPESDIEIKNIGKAINKLIPMNPLRTNKEELEEEAKIMGGG